ncbi:MAG: hypothetical protein LWW97_01535 [Deltaproteobacteria bacterium]|nr:hypothetical protein [Deltaproteobacteria bacterium]
MGFTVEQECPQCGAPVELDETDRLLSCPYCEVRSFLFAKDYFRLVLPHNAPGKDLIYAPYLRLKGALYYCQGMKVQHRILDITNAGTQLKGIPFSLGIRQQCPKIKFITPETRGSFLKFTLDQDKILARAGRFSTSDAIREQLYHRAFIGETFSLIYFPMYVKNNQLFNALEKKPIAKLDEGRNPLELAVRHPKWKLDFLATLCPQCGWDLKGEKDSVVLTCSNCNTAWSAAEGKLVKVNIRSVPDKGGNTLNLPFWKIPATAECADIVINSFADFIRKTGHASTRAIPREWENEELNFWIPAFKIHPKVFLAMSYRITFAFHAERTREMIPENNVYPVTLPRREAIESLKIVFANAIKDQYKKEIYPLLPKITFEPKVSTLVYLPFTETSMEMIQQQSRINFFKAHLKIGRTL